MCRPQELLLQPHPPLLPHSPANTHPWMGAWRHHGWVCSPLPRQEANSSQREGGSCLLFKHTLLGLELSRGGGRRRRRRCVGGRIVLVVDEAININHSKAASPSPALVSTASQDWERSRRQSQFIHLAGSLPLRRALSKGSCNESRSSRAEFASLRYDKIF